MTLISRTPRGERPPQQAVSRRHVPSQPRPLRTGGLLAIVALGLLVALAGLAAAEPPAAEPSAATDAPAAQSTLIDFKTQVEPILQRRCLECHGAEHRGGLRLDSRAGAAAGGDSGKPILGAPLATNELYQRIASGDRTYRMPKNADPLDESEIETIKQWVVQGTNWPSTNEPDPTYGSWLELTGRYIEVHDRELGLLRWYAPIFLAAQLVLLVIARARTASRRGRAWTTGALAAFCRFASRVSSRELVLVWLLLVGIAIVLVTIGREQALEAELTKLVAQRAVEHNRWAPSIYGYPPVPFRPEHPKRLSGTYYRGNCERNKNLFNGGNYLTATFQIALCDADHRQIELGDTVSGPLLAHVEIERAPGTTEALFSDGLISAVFFSEHFYGDTASKLEDKPVRLETLESGRRWVAFFPLRPFDDQGESSGVIYLFVGKLTDTTAVGTPHYAISYHLTAPQGKLAEGSELWMGSFGNSSVAEPFTSSRIPFNEWFDFKPIPPITGENTKDPKLLGVDEYVKKGLIKPPAPAQAPTAEGEKPVPDAPHTEAKP